MGIYSQPFATLCLEAALTIMALPRKMHGQVKGLAKPTECGTKAAGRARAPRMPANMPYAPGELTAESTGSATLSLLVLSAASRCCQALNRMPAGPDMRNVICTIGCNYAHHLRGPLLKLRHCTTAQILCT